MATATVSPRPAWPGIRKSLGNPIVATFAILIYLAVVISILISLNRADLWYPFYSLVTFPAFVLSPYVIMASKCREPSRRC